MLARFSASLSASLFALLALSATQGCGSSSNGNGNGNGNANGSDADGGGADSSADLTADSAVSGGDSGAVGILPLGDGGGLSTADGGCTKLNIALLGNLGDDASSNFQKWLVGAGTSVSSIQTSGEALTAAEIAPFDILILSKLTREYTTGEAAIFASWVQNGGGVISMTGFENDTSIDWHANSLLAPMQLAYTGSLLNGPVTDFATQPVTAGLTSVTFNGGYAIADLGGTASKRTPLAFLPDSNATDGGLLTVGVGAAMGTGHAFVWGDEWIEFDSEWSTIPQIQQLWVQVFGYVAPTSKCAINPPPK